MSSTSVSIAGRITVILDANGDLTLVYPTVSVTTSPYGVLEDCQILFGQ